MTQPEKQMPKAKPLPGDYRNTLVGWLKSNAGKHTPAQIAAATGVPPSVAPRILRELSSCLDALIHRVAPRPGLDPLRYEFLVLPGIPGLFSPAELGPSAPSGSMEPQSDISSIPSNELSVVTTPEVTPLTTLAPGQTTEFAQARRYYQGARLFASASTACLVLLGLELQRLRLLFDPQPGRRKKNSSTDGLISWDARVRAELRIGHATAWRWEAMAEEAQQRVAELSTVDLLERPILQLPEPQREQIVRAVQAATDGRNAKQLMVEWGITTKKPQSTGSPLTAEESARENAQEHIRPLIRMLAAVTANQAKYLVNLPLVTETPSEKANLSSLRDHLQRLLKLTQNAINAASQPCSKDQKPRSNPR